MLLSSMSGREATEPLLVMLGRADRARGDCNAAVPILEGVLRTHDECVTARQRDDDAELV